MIIHVTYSTVVLSPGNAVNSAINSNFKQVLKELQHPIERALEDAMLEISNDCVRDFTYEQLCPLE
jgi:hypothetical protein